MKARLSREDLIRGGFKEVWLYTTPENKNELEYYCFERRLLVEKTFIGEEGMDALLYGEVKDAKPLIVKEWLGNFETIKLTMRGIEIRYIDGTDIEWVKDIVAKETEWRREKAIRAKKKKQLEGGYVGGGVPYGYYSLKKKLYVDTYEKFVIEFVFYRRLQGISKPNIAKELNLRKFKNHSGHPFTSDNIEQILRQKRFYQGYVTVDGVEIRGKHRPVLAENDKKLVEEFSKTTFDEETEARISRNREILTKEEKSELKRSV